MQSSSVQKPRGKGACPTFLCARIREASRRRNGDGYDSVERDLIRVAGELQPHEDSDELWRAKLRVLQVAILEGRDREILPWLDREVPRVMSLIPAWRREQLLAGILSDLEEEHPDWFTEE